MAKTAFVTGATGFVGLNLVEALRQQGWDVIALHRATSDLSGLDRFAGVRRVVGDVTDARSLKNLIPRNIDCVFHVAGNTSLWGKASAEQDAVNIDGTRNVVRVALEKGAARFVHTSSIVAYGLHGGLITEETPTGGASARINYVRSKALAEREVRQGIAKGLKAVIVNPSNIIGCYDTQNWSRMFLLVAEKRLPGVPPGGGSFCHARAVARAHIVAAEKGRIGANYLLGGAEASYRRLVQQMAVVVKLFSKRVPCCARWSIWGV
ncbi:MAG: NAD-dependent epimerase/dehydratase family protein [Hydrocarboniphaga effusa]|nr:NAD-dependent epimerase/dehydratase family protein [Hydrocarboniphaga effusa]